MGYLSLRSNQSLTNALVHEGLEDLTSLPYDYRVHYGVIYMIGYSNFLSLIGYYVYI